MPMRSARNLGLDLVRATEAAALAAGRWMGTGKREAGDAAASEAMYRVLNGLDMEGRIVVGEEGRQGPLYLLRSGMRIGSGEGLAMDVVADPIDGRNLLAQGKPGAISVAAVTPRGAMWSPAPAIYMEKIVVDRGAAHALVPECMDAPAAWTLALIARVTGQSIRDLVVFVLDRPRHRDLIEEIRTAGARVMLRTDGDVAGALLAASPTGQVDVLMGIGGAAEGMIAACGVKALGGAMLARLAPQSKDEQDAVVAADLDLRRVLALDELISGKHIYFAVTGITDGPLLNGVRYHGDRAETHSIVMRAETGTRRTIYAEHVLAEQLLPEDE